MAGMEIYNALRVLHLKPFSDSQLEVSQVKGKFEAHDPSVIAYLAKAKKKSSMFQNSRLNMYQDQRIGKRMPCQSLLVPPLMDVLKTFVGDPFEAND